MKQSCFRIHLNACLRWCTSVTDRDQKCTYHQHQRHIAGCLRTTWRGNENYLVEHGNTYLASNLLTYLHLCNYLHTYTYALTHTSIQKRIFFLLLFSCISLHVYRCVRTQNYVFWRMPYIYGGKYSGLHPIHEAILIACGLLKFCLLGKRILFVM